MNQSYELEINVPIPLDGYWGDSVDFVAERLIEQYEKYGLKRFSLSVPSNGHMNIGYASTEFYLEKAERFKELKEKLSAYPIELGWWVANTLHTGEAPGKGKYVNINGNVQNFTICPLDESFITEFSQNIAMFAKLTKPAFIFLEDDFNISTGCFCDKHLNEFAKRIGTYYSREQLKEFNNNPTPETIEILKKWREFSKDVMVRFAKIIRAEVDKETPEIPIGTHQPACTDCEGFSSEDITRAFSGEKHTPFSRIYAMPYCCHHDYQIPEILFHALYCKQHFNQDFKFLHESDTYPHSRYFCSASKMKTMMHIAYSYGFDGGVFWALPFFGNPDDETAYSKMFASERKRFTEISRIAKMCKIKGAQITNDPFYYTIGNVISDGWNPLWTRVLGNFGTPYTTLESEVVFWDRVMATYSDNETVMKNLSKGLFLDGEAAKILCNRGFGKYIGVEMGNVVSTGIGEFDQCSYEIIKDGFIEGIGNTMANSRAWCPTGNGVLVSLTPNNPKCEIISEVYNMADKFMSVAMTRFENELGGKIIVMGTTLENNVSQCLYNYPRRTLIQNLIKWCCDEYVFVRNTANIFCVMNECATDNFIGMISLYNFCDDAYEKAHIYLPSKWRNAKEFLSINPEGNWIPLKHTKVADGIILDDDIGKLQPVCILAK